jgi:uncharacterized protein
MRIIGIHGYRSSPRQHFWPALEDELKKRGHEVLIPELPDPENPDPEIWTKTLVEAARVLTDEDIIVGHSLGGALALRFLEAVEARTTPKACVLISTPWFIKDERFRGFFLSDLDHDVLMWRASRFHVIHAKDDHVIPLDHAQKYAQVFHANLITPEVGGHFNESPTYPIILDTILSAIEEPIIFAPGKSLPDAYSDLLL